MIEEAIPLPTANVAPVATPATSAAAALPEATDAIAH